MHHISLPLHSMGHSANVTVLSHTESRSRAVQGQAVSGAPSCQLLQDRQHSTGCRSSGSCCKHVHWDVNSQTGYTGGAAMQRPGICMPLTTPAADPGRRTLHKLLTERALAVYMLPIIMHHRQGASYVCTFVILLMRLVQHGPSRNKPENTLL